MGKAVYLACILSNLSQLPYFVRGGMTQRLAFPGWILLLIVIFFTRKIYVSKSAKRICGIALLFVAWCAILTIFMGNKYFSSSLVYAFFISLFVFALGNVAGEHLTPKNLKTLMVLYVFTTMIVTAAIFFEYFGFG